MGKQAVISCQTSDVQMPPAGHLRSVLHAPQATSRQPSASVHPLGSHWELGAAQDLSSQPPATEQMVAACLCQMVQAWQRQRAVPVSPYSATQALAAVVPERPESY